MTYVAGVRSGKDTVPVLIAPVRMPFHYAVRVAWTNLTESTALKRLAGEQRIVFSVVADRIQQMSERRWNRTIRCKVINLRSED
jgi:hypothetical protein